MNQSSNRQELKKVSSKQNVKRGKEDLCFKSRS